MCEGMQTLMWLFVWMYAQACACVRVWFRESAGESEGACMQVWEHASVGVWESVRVWVRVSVHEYECVRMRLWMCAAY